MANHPNPVQRFSDRIAMHRTMMKRGLYRTVDSYLGECAKVHESAGDAFPFLLPDIYNALGFSPAYTDLPFHDDSPTPSDNGGTDPSRG